MRVLESHVATTALERGLATRAQLQAISRTWLAWADDADAWLSIPHGEILATPALISP